MEVEAVDPETTIKTKITVTINEKDLEHLNKEGSMLVQIQGYHLIIVLKKEA